MIHEFAHQARSAGGPANGARPQLASRAEYAEWSRVMQTEFGPACGSAWRTGEPGPSTLMRPPTLRSSFAVVSELFFEQPTALAAYHPALYRVLSSYYRLNPLSW